METINALFEKYYSAEQLKQDIRETEIKEDDLLRIIRERLPYDLDKPLQDFAQVLSFEIAKKSFGLGFSLAVKLLSESFVKSEKVNTNNIKSV